MPARAVVIPPHGHLRWLLVCAGFGVATTPALAWATFPWWLLALPLWQQVAILFGLGPLFVLATRRRCQHVRWILGSALASTAGQWVGGLVFVRLYAGSLDLTAGGVLPQVGAVMGGTTLLCVVVVALERLFWRRTVVGPTDCCPECGYCLRGAGAWRCPECGRPFSCDELLLTRAALGIDATLPEPSDERSDKARVQQRRRRLRVARRGLAALALLAVVAGTALWLRHLHRAARISPAVDALLARIEVESSPAPTRLRIKFVTHVSDEDGSEFGSDTFEWGCDGDRWYLRNAGSRPHPQFVFDGRIAFRFDVGAGTL